MMSAENLILILKVEEITVSPVMTAVSEIVRVDTSKYVSLLSILLFDANVLTLPALISLLIASVSTVALADSDFLVTGSTCPSLLSKKYAEWVAVISLDPPDIDTFGIIYLLPTFLIYTYIVILSDTSVNSMSPKLAVTKDEFVFLPAS